VKIIITIQNSDLILKKIKIPFLSIFTKDDPIIPYEAIPLKLFQQNSNLITIISKKRRPHGLLQRAITSSVD
jgi:poly(3-hydroxyalkanoate) synthetase